MLLPRSALRHSQTDIGPRRTHGLGRGPRGFLRGEIIAIGIRITARIGTECRIGNCLRRFLCHSTFVIRHSRHILLIPGTSSVEHLRENVTEPHFNYLMRQLKEWSWRDQRHRTRRDRGNGAFGESDIEGKAAMGSGE